MINKTKLNAVKNSIKNIFDTLKAIPRVQFCQRVCFFDKSLTAPEDDNNTYRILPADKPWSDNFERLPSFKDKKSSYEEHCSSTKLNRVKAELQKAQATFLANPSFEENHRQWMEKVSHYLCLLMLRNWAQRVMANALSVWSSPPQDLDWLEKEVASLNKEKEAFVKTLIDTAHTVILARQKEGMPMDLSKPLAQQLEDLSQSYQATYDKKYGHGFWRWIKDLCRKSARVQEINFLQAISNDTNCNDTCRKEAMLLVRDHIIEQETFGANSQLARLLDTMIQSCTDVQCNQNYSNLKCLVKDNVTLQNLMPYDLAFYFQPTAREANADNMRQKYNLTKV